MAEANPVVGTHGHIKMFNSLNDFYRSPEWLRFREIVISERMADDGMIYDEYTGKPIVKKYDLILHHKTELTEENVRDFDISLNPDNIMIVSHKTHNLIHNRLGYGRKQVFLVYGAPCAGKAEWVKDNASEGDLIVDLDNIWQCVSGCDRYVHPNRVKSIVFRVRNDLLDVVKYRFGKWMNAYVVGGYAMSSERERICKELGAREIFIEAAEDECMQRAGELGEVSDEMKKYIGEWFEKFS